MADSTELLIEGAIAAGLGLFIGLEREHSELTGAPDADDPPAETRASAAASAAAILGVRSFALLALLGWAAALLGERQAWLPIAGLVVTAGLVMAQYLRADAGHGLTTELAAVMTYLLGMMVHHDRRIALALGLVTTLLLLAKPWTRTLVPKLRRIELTAALQLGIGLAVLLPLLPTEARDPWGVLSPRKIGLFVLLIAGLGFVGYVLHRVLGQTKGAGLAGLVGGLVSSTAVTAAMAQDAAKRPEHRLSGQLATFLANAVMPIRVLVVTALLSRAITRALALPLGAMAAIMLLGAVWKWRALAATAPGQADEQGKLPLKNPFALLPALKWGVILCAVLVVSAIAKQEFGERGVYLTAAASGLADVDAVTLAVSRGAQSGQLGVSAAVLAITIAVIANTCVKAGIALLAGKRAFGAHVAGVLLGAGAVAGGLATLGLR